MRKVPKSGRPKKRFTPKTRQHYNHVQFTARADEYGNIKIDTDSNARLTSEQAVAGTYSLISRYSRESGKDKLAFSHTTEKNGAFLTEKDQLLDSFDQLVSIDTNTVTIEGIRVSATCLLISKSPLNGPTDAVEFDKKGYVFFDVPIDINPEMVALDIALMNYIEESAKRIGIVTDSDLGKHSRINERTLPFIGDKLLRADVKLIYASTDTGDALSNKIIRHADRTANLVLENCKAHPEELKPTDNSYPFCRGWMIAPFEGD